MNNSMKRIASVLVGLLLCSVTPVRAIDLAVTQITSISTGVIANGISGVITTYTSTAAAGSTTTFTVTNTGVRSSNGILLTVVNYSGTYGTNGFPRVSVGTVADGSFTINVVNDAPANALAGTLKIAFLVI